MSENTPIKNWAEDLNRHVPKEDTQMANRHKKRCSTWLVVGEMQTKTTMRFHLTPFRMTLIKKSTNNKLLECGEKGTCDWWECTLVQPLWRTVRRCLKKLKKKTKLKIELEIQPLSLYLEKTIIQKDICTPVFIAAVFTIAKTWSWSICPL